MPSQLLGKSLGGNLFSIAILSKLFLTLGFRRSKVLFPKQLEQMQINIDQHDGHDS